MSPIADTNSTPADKPVSTMEYRVRIYASTRTVVRTELAIKQPR